MTQQSGDEPVTPGRSGAGQEASAETAPVPTPQPAGQPPTGQPVYGTPPTHGEPPVYGSPAPNGPPPAPPAPPPGWQAPGYGGPTGSPTGSPGAPGPISGVEEERQWALFAHLGGVLAIFPVVHLLPALVIYSIYQSRSEFIRDQAREALNFQIVVLIAYFAARILDVLPFFPNLVVLVWLFSLIFSVLAAVAASRGERYRYPLTYRFLT